MSPSENSAKMNQLNGAKPDSPAEPVNVVMKGDEKSKAADFANYFCSYANLYHQKQMLTDHQRMQAYHAAIDQNRDQFEGKVVLDVGTGSGILAIWAARAGARKVYAVEFTDMAKHATTLVEKSGLASVVTVIQSSVEDLQLPEKVDIIVSEWMGYFLVRESMLDSVVRARDHWLKPGGLMFPGEATMYWAPLSDEQDRLQRQQEYISSMQEWYKFKQETRELYGVDMGSLEGNYEEEQREYYLLSSIWAELHPSKIVARPAAIKTLDLHTCTLQDVQGVEETPFSFHMEDQVRVSGFAGWFTVDFRGTAENPLEEPVELSTAPDVGYTHWGQQVCYLQLPHDAHRGSKIEGTIQLRRQKQNIRLYDIIVKHSLRTPDGKEVLPVLTEKFNMP